MQANRANDEAKVTRRHALQTIAQFPIQMYGLAFLVGSHYLLPSPEEFLPVCAASLTACRELRKYEGEPLFAVRLQLMEARRWLESRVEVVQLE